MWAEEYTNLLNDFTSAVEDELLQYVRGLILYGSYRKEQTEGPGWTIPGTSDLDLVLIVDLDDPNPEKPPRRLSKISEALTVFFVHPVYAPILDLTLLEYHDLPVQLGMSFSPIHAVAASKGEVLLGKNVLADTSYSEKMLNRCAKIMISQGFESIKSGFLQRNIIGEQQLAYEYADIVLDMAHSTLAANGIFNLVRIEVPEKFDLVLGDTIGSAAVDIVYEAKKWRMGSQKMKRLEFLQGTLHFAQDVMKYVRNPFNSTK
jgi:predicted nucleotidyltransferase